MTLPLVSICMPTRNGAAYLHAALHSALTQDYPQLELIISDDASNDGTLDLVRQLTGQAPFPVHVSIHTPVGMAANWNACLQLAHGSYIKFLLQDDLLEPDCIGRMVAAAEVDQRVGMVFSRRRLISGNDPDDDRLRARAIQRINDVHRHWRNLQPIQPGTRLLADPQLLRFPVNKIGEPTAVLLRTEAVRQTGQFSDAFVQRLDIQYWLRLLENWKIAFIDAELAAFRIHANQATSANAASGIHEGLLFSHWLYASPLRAHLHPRVKWQLRWRHHPALTALRRGLRLPGRVVRTVRRRIV